MTRSHSSPEGCVSPAAQLFSREVIDLHDEEQLTQLSEQLRLGRDVLREAVKTFGPSLAPILALLVLPR